MGRYRLGNIIRMTRKSLSITQEQLCDGICSVETLSRMESGKQKPNKETYELLMARMGRIKDRAYSMLSVSQFQVLEKKKMFEDCLHKNQYENAERIFEEIKSCLGDSIIDRQFVTRSETILNYLLKRISADDALDGLYESIRMTLPKFGEISIANWPLNYLESVIILNIANIKSEIGDYKYAIKILQETSQALKQSYMDENQRVKIEISNLYNLSKWLGLIGDYDEAVEIIYSGIELCRIRKVGNVLPHLLFNLVWINNQRYEGVISQENKEECVKRLIQAYYIAEAIELPIPAQYAKKLIEDNYSDYVNYLIV